jgi:oxygen-independent coproporphyrinogen-3 oxidase
VRTVRGLYVHVPFCTARCGYCDFNTYVAPEAERAGYAALAIVEIERAAAAWPGPIDTVFFGGGTPTLLAPDDLAAILRAAEERFGLVPGAEVTTEANPETVDLPALAALREAGFTRVSLGMQSAVPRVLEILDRAHTPGRAIEAAGEARVAGFEHVSLDLIYGTPGESDDDWRMSVEAAVSARTDHVSAYALTVEPGTALHARVQRGELPAPDDDVLAERYAIADDAFTAAGLEWYEISNWAGPGGECRHNLGYWRRDGEWWGIGPGAHSFAGGVRWSNVRRPAEYARRLRGGESPEDAYEEIDDATRAFEQVMLELRLRDGLVLADTPRADAARELADDGLIDISGGRAVLTRRGRMLADRVVIELTG